MVDVCTTMIDLMTGSVLQLMAIASITLVLILALFMMYSKSISNEKLDIWSRTELVQLFISICFVVLFGIIVTSYCALTSDSLAIFVEGGTQKPNLNIFEASEAYLLETAQYSHQALNVNRYYLEAFEMFKTRNRQLCADAMCLFGYTGDSWSPYAGLSPVAGAFYVSFNTTLFSFLSALNFLLILKYILSGILLFMLPLGTFMRSVPFMRKFGALLMSVAISFIFIYPLILSVFYLLPKDVLFWEVNHDVFTEYQSDDLIAGKSNFDILADSFEMGQDEFMDVLLPVGTHYEVPLYLAGMSFIASVFIPSFALLAAIGAVSYVTRFLGEEVDLSRVIQMV
ncbi:MAG: hypothetical protein ABII22_03225 [Candidatus Micrarchaeota archaeon]